MKVSAEHLEESQVRLHIEVEPERSAKSIDRAYQRLVNRVSIPGFRKGKAPRQVVERMVGAEALVQEGIDLLLPEVYREAIAETGIQPVGEPEIAVAQQNPLVVDLTVPVRPSVELGDYHEISTERDRVTVREEEVEAVLRDLREEHSEWASVERPAAAGDRVTIDVTARVRGAPILYDTEGKAIVQTDTGKPVIEQKGAEYKIEPGSAAPVVGFAEQLVGMQAGAEKRFELSFPSNHPDGQLANKAVMFTVVVHAVKEQRLPALDDEFAKTLGDYEDVASLRAKGRETLQRQAEREAQARLEERVLNMVLDRARIELPSVLIEREVDRLVSRTERRVLNAGVKMDDFLRVSKRSPEELRTEYRADAIANLRRYFVLDEIAKVENVVVTPEEIEAEVEQIKKALGEEGAKAAAVLDEPERREDLGDDLRRRKALDRLLAIATGEGSEKPTEDRVSPIDGEGSDGQSQSEAE